MVECLFVELGPIILDLIYFQVLSNLNSGRFVPAAENYFPHQPCLVNWPNIFLYESTAGLVICLKIVRGISDLDLFKIVHIPLFLIVIDNM